MMYLFSPFYMPGKFTFYCAEVENNLARFDENEAGHAIRSLRYKQGDQIEFTDGKGHLYLGNIAGVEKKGFTAEITWQSDLQASPGIHVYVGMLKSGDRMEWIVEKCTELGVAGIWFTKTANSERSHVNAARLSKTALAAMKQSHRAWLPATGFIAWPDILKNAPGNRFVAHISGKSFSMIQPKMPVSLLIGPEGDFTETEIRDALTAGFNPFQLGSAVLRAETATIAAVSCFSVLNV